MGGLTVRERLGYKRSSGMRLRMMSALMGACLLGTTGLQAQVAVAPLAPLTLSAVAGDKKFVTRHHGLFNGHAIGYSAEVAETIIKDGHQAPVASLISFSY